MFQKGTCAIFAQVAPVPTWSHVLWLQDLCSKSQFATVTPSNSRSLKIISLSISEKSNMHNLHITFWTSSKTELVLRCHFGTLKNSFDVRFLDIKLSFCSKSLIFDEFRCFAVNFFWPQLRHREWYVQNLHIPHSPPKPYFLQVSLAKLAFFLIGLAEPVTICDQLPWVVK